MNTKYSKQREFRRFPQSQRDCVTQPRVARNELPWERELQGHNPNGVAARRRNCRDATPLGLRTFSAVTQGSSFLATLGFKPESRWDSSPEFPKWISLSPHLIPATRNTELESSANPQTGISALPKRP